MRMTGRLLLGLAALLGVASSALGQGALLQGGPITPGHAPMYTNSGTSQAVVQDSGPAGGGAAGYGMSEGLYVARGTGTAPYSGQGTGPYGANWCNYDAPITNATGYHYLCLSPNGTGGYGMIAFGAGGGAASLPFVLRLNGTDFTFPSDFSGFVLAAAPHSSGQIACWTTPGTTITGCVNGSLSGTLSVTGAVTASSTLSVGSTLAVTGATTLSSTLAVNGNTTLGDASGDTVTINGTAVSAPNALNINSGTLYVAASSGYVGIGSTTPLSPLFFGAGGSIVSDPVVTISRLVDNSGSGFAHGYSDTSVISRSSGGPIGYNSYDSRPVFTTTSFDHYAGYQSAPTVNTSGTVSQVENYRSELTVTTGTVTNRYGYQVSDATGAGTVTNQYGLYIEQLTKGALNYALYVAGTTPSRIGGPVQFDSAITMVSTLSVGGTVTIQPGAAVYFNMASTQTATSYGVFKKGGTNTDVGYIGTDGGAIASTGTGDNFGLRSIGNLLLYGANGSNPSIIDANSVSTPKMFTGRYLTSTPAAASAVPAFAMGSDAVGVYWGTGDPNAALSAPKGSVYIRTDGSSTSTRLYVNTNGSSGWASVTTSS